MSLRPDFTGTVTACAAWLGQAVWVRKFCAPGWKLPFPTLAFAAVQQKHLNLMCLLLCHCSSTKVKVTFSLKHWFAEAHSALPCKGITVSDSLIQGSPFLPTPGFSDPYPR